MIVFLAPDKEIFATATATLSESHPDIRIEQGLLSAGVLRARELAQQGVDIIITRGGTASEIKKALPDMTVVEVPITGFDILQIKHLPSSSDKSPSAMTIRAPVRANRRTPPRHSSAP